MLCDDVDGKLKELEEDGVEFILAQGYAGTHAYLDMTDSPGIMIQLMPTFDSYLDLFKVAEDASLDWDGVTEPVRQLHW